MKSARRQGDKEMTPPAAPLPVLAGRTPLQEAERLLGVSFIGAGLTFFSLFIFTRLELYIGAVAAYSVQVAFALVSLVIEGRTFRSAFRLRRFNIAQTTLALSFVFFTYAVVAGCSAAMDLMFWYDHLHF